MRRVLAMVSLLFTFLFVMPSWAEDAPASACSSRLSGDQNAGDGEQDRDALGVEGILRQRVLHGKD
jgi:hypothetical protein